MESNGISKEVIRTYRYLAGDLAPNFVISKNFSLGPYYLYSRALEKDLAKNTHFVSFRTSFSNIGLSKQIDVTFVPQIYYLKIDRHHGTYFTSSLSVARKNFPLSISAVINKKIQSQIASDNFLWNVSLVYSFSKKYTRI